MDDHNFLIIGANGQLGKALQARYPNAAAVDSAELDITNAAAVANFDWAHTTTILNAAAYTNVDGAETSDGRLAAWAVNAAGAANLANLAIQKDLTLIHISTDYVFDGTSALHTENEAFSPLSVYGSSKAAGDIAIQLAPKHYILRTSWVIGEGKNFVRTMLELGKKGVNPTVVSDQIGRLTFTNELASATHHLLTASAAYGTYNVTNDGEPESWSEITRKIFDYAGFNLSVTDTTTAKYFEGKSNIAPRPLQSTLDLKKIHDTGFASSEWQASLKEYVEKEVQQ